MTMMHKNQSVDPHRFAMIPQADAFTVLVCMVPAKQLVD